jgi:hypothetical protein
MKKAVIVWSMMVIGATGYGATVRENCGCGLGTMALGDKEATVFVQMCATFLNGLTANQTFGITSGTLDCAPATAVVSNERVRDFIQDNMDQLAMDIAVGQGETLNALADLMAVPASDREALFGKLQKNFDRLYTSHSVSSEEFTANLDKVVNG